MLGRIAGKRSDPEAITQLSTNGPAEQASARARAITDTTDYLPDFRFDPIITEYDAPHLWGLAGSRGR